MKTRDIFMAVLTVVVILVSAAAFAFLPALLGAGVTLAFAAGAGAVSQATPDTAVAAAASSELLLTEISKKITEMKPAATPLDTILRNIGLTVDVGAWKTEWYSSDVRGISTTVAVSFDTSASGTVDSTGDINTITVTDIHIFAVDDNVLVQGIDGGDGKELVLHIVAKNTGPKTISVIAVNGLGVDEDLVPDIPQTTTIIRIGNAKNENDAQTTPYTTFPSKTYNFCQIHMAQVEEGAYLALHNKEVNWDITDYRLQALYDMRRSFELTSLFGARGYKYDPEGEDWKYFSGGIYRYADNALEYTSGAMTEKRFNEWARDVFTGNSGSDTRVLFAGKDLMTDMMSVSSVVKQIEAKGTEVKFGIKFNMIETSFGTLAVKHHNLFNDVGWAAKGMVLDVNNIERHVFKSMASTKIDLKGSGQKNADAYKIDETFCIATRYPATHFIIEPSAGSGS
jgi:hypothetical protein